MKNINRLFLIFFMAVFACQPAYSQNSGVKSQPDYKNDPVWIKMMDDPNVNYYEAVKAYETYWSGREKPGEEEEMMAEGTDKVKKREIEKEQRERERESSGKNGLKIRLEREDMTYQVKRFENWMHEVKPFVQEDGRILSEEDKHRIWLRQQEEIKTQQKKDK